MPFFTSDTHFNDSRILRIDRRPFASLNEHDEALIAFWNETVGRDDEVWHLGDFARHDKAGVEVLLSRLNGQKHLISATMTGQKPRPRKAGRASSIMRNSCSTRHCSSCAIIRFGLGTKWEKSRSTCTAIPTADSSRSRASTMSALTPEISDQFRFRCCAGRTHQAAAFGK